MSRTDEQRAMNSDGQGIGNAPLFGIGRKLSGLTGNLSVRRRAVAAARALARTPTPPQARAASLLALGAECAKFLEKIAAKVGPFARRGGVAGYVAASKDGSSPVGEGAALGVGI